MNEVDVAVIGAGPAGMAAAIKAKEAGAENVVLLERDAQTGGLLHQCIHNGFGLLYFQEDLTGPEYAWRFTEKLMDTGVQTLLETMVIGITKNREIKAVNSKNGLISFQPRSIVLAMGCRERTRGAINISGTRPAGVLTAGTAQRYVNVEGFIPGKKAVILGTGDIGMIMARRLALEGVEIAAVLEILPFVGGLIRNEVQCLHDFAIPVFLKHTVTQIHGEERLEAVTVAQVDADGNPVAGTERIIECDTLLLSVGLIPENELSQMIGIELDPVTGGAVVTETRETSVPGIFAGGNVLHVHDLVDNVTRESELAGECAARFARGDRMPAGKITLKPGRNIKYIVPQTISGIGDVTLYLRVREPARNVRFEVGGVIVGKTRLGVKPSSMEKIELQSELLKRLSLDSTAELVVNCLSRGE
jgi:thioredoxin reductase